MGICLFSISVKSEVCKFAGILNANYNSSFPRSNIVDNRVLGTTF